MNLLRYDIDEIVKENIDAFIVQDMGVARLLKDRYKNINFKEWITDRIHTLKKISNSKIIVYTTGEIDLSDIKILKKSLRICRN